MRVSSPSIPLSLLLSTLCRQFSSNAKLPTLTKIRCKHRLRAIKEAQDVLTDYFHTTRSVPYMYAEYISKNSIYSLSDVISQVYLSVSSFRETFLKFLTRNPINEYGFFYESIGIDYLNIPRFLNPNVHFFSDDSSILDAACALAGHGFPWDKLGRLYMVKVSIFEKQPEFLRDRVNGLVEIGFSNQQLVGICLCFPGLLDKELGLFGENYALLSDLKRVFVEFGLESLVKGNVDVWYEVCQKIKVFYDLGVEKGKVGDVMEISKTIFLDHPVKVFAEKAEFFCRLGVEKMDVGLLLLCYPGILSIEFENRVISVFGFLIHFGVEPEKLNYVTHTFPHIFGRNKMTNLPHILRALDLHEWFFNKVKCGYYHLLANNDLSTPDEGVDEEYIQNFVKIKSSNHAMSKLTFFHGIGFGENKFMMRLLTEVHGNARELQDRFNFLLSEGIEFSKLCKMINHSPRILNREIIDLKLNIEYLQEELGLSHEFLESFPTYLVYSLEKRIKPRYRFLKWLTEQGWCKKKYRFSSIIAISEKRFLAQLSCIHPKAPQLWLEQFAMRNKIHEARGTCEDDTVIATRSS